MDKYVYYTLHLIISNLNKNNIFKAIREFEELKARKKEIAKEVEKVIRYYIRQLLNKYIVIIGDYCINKRLCLDGYRVVLAEIFEHNGDFVITKYEYYDAETLQQAYSIAEKLARQYNAKIVYDFER